MSSRSNQAAKLGIAMLLGLCTAAQDVKLNVTYVCSGERMYVESCNIRDLPTPQPARSPIPTARNTTASWPTPARPGVR